ncbi:MAG: hypothetical protein H0U56_15565 [Methylibium sp.]|nr:hypothetical protein [Methylibium sp.]
MKADPELWCSALDWWLNSRDAACGVRSGMGGQIAQLERGGAGGGSDIDLAGSYVHPYHDGQVSFRGQTRAVAKDRRIRLEWQRIPSVQQRVLVAHYAHGRWPIGTQALSLLERTVGDREGVFMPGAALWLAQADGTLGELLDACQRKPTAPVIGKARANATAAVRAAHRAYYEAAKGEATAWLEAVG